EERPGHAEGPGDFFDLMLALLYVLAIAATTVKGFRLEPFLADDPLVRHLSALAFIHLLLKTLVGVLGQAILHRHHAANEHAIPEQPSSCPLGLERQPNCFGCLLHERETGYPVFGEAKPQMNNISLRKCDLTAPRAIILVLK